MSRHLIYKALNQYAGRKKHQMDTTDTLAAGNIVHIAGAVDFFHGRLSSSLRIIIKK
jgi:hypothetical protein